MENTDILRSLAGKLEIARTGVPDERLRELIETRISDLIANDFNRLVRLLYRLDISEKKLYATLEANKGTDAAVIITALIIEQQVQKAQSRRQENQFKKDDNIPEDEKW